MIRHAKAEDFIPTLEDGSVDLLLIDPPYFGIVKDSWDNQWETEAEYCDWLLGLLILARPKLKTNGSLIMFGGIGKHGSHPLLTLLPRIEQHYVFRNWITWGKRRAYGKSHDYLFCREEILWFSASSERTEVQFNIPLLDEKRGYAGFNKKYPAKSEFKRVSNVWSDIPELFKPERSCQKPLPLLGRLILTHSNPDGLVVDFFAGSGSTSIAAQANGRRFLGCEAIEADALKASQSLA